MIDYIAETGSTNADLIARLRSGEALADGNWLVCDRQIAGRGRQGRYWSGGEGNFMGSVAVRLKAGDPFPASLALVSGLALFEAVTALSNLPPTALQLKWPNDLLLRGAKLAGILLEREGQWVVVGIGVNLSKAPDIEGRQTIALAEYGPTPDRNSFAEMLAQCLVRQVNRWRVSGLEPILAAWSAAAHPVGTALAVHDSTGKRLAGWFDGLEAEGAMRLRLEDGSTRVIHAGDVTLEED